jgi:hypothetical protein
MSNLLQALSVALDLFEADVDADDVREIGDDEGVVVVVSSDVISFEQPPSASFASSSSPSPSFALSHTPSLISSSSSSK